MGETDRELDHLFLVVESESRARAMMDAAGLRVNYARAHPGQGTRNLCACLDDAFVELIWADGSAVSPESERVTLGARLRGSGSPLGLSWRGASPPDCIGYAAPFLPDGVTIPVLHESLDPALPFVFRTPGGKPPAARDPALVGTRQHPDLARVARLALRLDSDAAVALVSRVLPQVETTRGEPGLSLELAASDGRIARRIDWAF